MKKLKKTLLVLIFVLALSPFIIWAQEGSVPPNPDIPPSEQPPVEQPISEEIPPQENPVNPEPQGVVITDPAPTPETIPTTTEEPAPTPNTTPSPTPTSTAPETQTINLGTATIDVALEPEENNFSTILAVIAGALVVLGAGTLWKLKSQKSSAENTEEKEEDGEKKCLNFKKLMEEKLNEIADLKSQFTSMAENKAHAEMRKVIRDTKAESLVKVIEKAQKDYEKFKKLYEECIAQNKNSNTVFIFHGTEGYPEENWFPWMKENLEKEGCKVFVPEFPSPKGEPAKIAEWLEVLKKYEKNINKNTILIGHSLGGVFALRVLEKLNHSVKAVFLVGTPAGIQPIDGYDRAKSFSGFEFDWDKIKKNAKNFGIFQSDDDPYVGIENGKDLAKNLGVEMTFIPYAGHFNKASGYSKFKELFDKIKELENNA